MSVLITRLLAVINAGNIDSTDYQIAQAFLAHYDELHDLSITEIAQICNVSKSKISKFVKYLGFDDFIDLKDNVFKHEFTNKFKNERNFNRNILDDIYKNGYDHFKTAILTDIQNLFADTDQALIRQLATDIHHYQHVAAFGLLFSGIGALDLQYKLAYHDKYITCFSDDKKQDNFVKNASDDTLIIIYSNSGDFVEFNQTFLSQSQKKSFLNSNAKIVVITSNDNTQLLPFVDYVIKFENATEIQNHSLQYNILNDFITYEYRQIIRQQSLQK